MSSWRTRLQVAEVGIEGNQDIEVGDAGAVGGEHCCTGTRIFVDLETVQLVKGPPPHKGGHLGLSEAVHTIATRGGSRG